MSADCVNVNVSGKDNAHPASRDLPVINMTAVNEALAIAFAKAGPTHDSTKELNDIAAALAEMTIFYEADVHVIWNPAKVTLKNQLRAGLLVATHMVDSEQSLSD